MEFIDHTGHIFSLKSYNEYPVGYEYDTNDYIFWLDDDYTGSLSVNNYYVKAIRPLLLNSTLSKQCCSSNISYPAPQQIEYLNELDNNIYEYDIEHELKIKSQKRQITDIHISVESQYYTLIASSQIQELVSKNKRLSDYIQLDSQKDLKTFLHASDINVVEDLVDYTFKSTIENGIETTQYGSDNSIDNQFCMIPFYVVGNTDTEGTWLTNVLIHVEYEDGDNEWCPITIGGTYRDESEELIINGKNMGIELPKDIIKAVYQSSFYNDIENTTLYNEKIKELLLNYMHIKMEAGNFRSAIESLKWFGYGNHITIFKLLQTDNQFLNQYILDNFDTSVDLLHSFNTFRNSTYVSLQLPENIELDELEPINWEEDWFMGENKPYIEDLFKKVIEKRYDEGDIVFYRPYYDYIFDEIGLKLACLKYYYEKFFLPIHLSVKSVSITHKVFANDIKYIQSAEVKTANPPLTTADPNITVKFTGEHTKYIYNHKVYVDENYNSFSNTYEMASNYTDVAYYVNDVCVDIPICFMSTLDTQYYDCVLLLCKEGKKIYESHFNFWQRKRLTEPDKDGIQKFEIENAYEKFIIVPKIINKRFNINYWLNKNYQIKLGVNGNWYFYDFTIKLPEFQFNFGKLVYKYNVADGITTYSLDKNDAEYIDEDSPYYVNGMNDRNRLSVINLFRQVNKIDERGVDFNSFMYVPSLVEVNDINFIPNLNKRIDLTIEELNNELNKWHANQVQISDLKFPLEDDSVYVYNDVINAYYRLSVEETSQIKNLTVKYRGFLNWHDYVKYMTLIKDADTSDPAYADKIDEISEQCGVIFDCYITYDFVNNTITSRYPEYNHANLADWFGVDADDNVQLGGIGPRNEFKWNYVSTTETIFDNYANEIIVETIQPDSENKYENLNYIKLEDGQPIHYKVIKYVTTNAVFNYIRSNDTFGTFDLALVGDLGTQIINNGYIGIAVHLLGELQNGYKFEKLKYGEPPVREINEESGDYCPFSEKCNCVCGHNCKYAKPIQSDRPKDDGHYILTDTFNRSIDKLDRIGKADEKQIYSDTVTKSISELIAKYKESPVITNNTKYLNRIHMYHLYDNTGEMVKYENYDAYPNIIRDQENCDEVNSVYMNHIKDNSLIHNNEYFYQDLYKQPVGTTERYLQFFETNGDAKLIYPADSYFDFDTYLMHDDTTYEKINSTQARKYGGQLYTISGSKYVPIDKSKIVTGNSYYKVDVQGYWYIVFISTMTIDCILSNKDLIAKKTINYEAMNEITNGSDVYYRLSSDLLVNKTNKMIYTNDFKLVKTSDLPENLTNVDVSNVIGKDYTIKQKIKQNCIYHIVDKTTNTYLENDIEYVKLENVNDNTTEYVKWSKAAKDNKFDKTILRYKIEFDNNEDPKQVTLYTDKKDNNWTVFASEKVITTIDAAISKCKSKLDSYRNVVKRYKIDIEQVGSIELAVLKYDISVTSNNWTTVKTYTVLHHNTNEAIEKCKIYMDRWHSDLLSEAEGKITELVTEEKSHYDIQEKVDMTKGKMIYTVVRNDWQVIGSAMKQKDAETIITEHQKDRLNNKLSSNDTQYEVKEHTDQMLKATVYDVYFNDIITIDSFESKEKAQNAIQIEVDGYAAKFEIINDVFNTSEYIYYNGLAPVYVDSRYRTPLLAPNFGELVTSKYTLKWKRSSNQFLINRMYFVDSEGVNQFNNDDIIVASIDNVNFPYIFETGTKWKFEPMSLGMLDSCNVESTTNSAIVSIGNGNKVYNKGYYNIDVRYSVDAFNQHQYMKKSRILVK